MSNYYFYPYIALTGGADGALDSLDGSLLKDGDAAFVVHNGVLRSYVLDADSAATESSPDVIAPDSNAGDKRWIQIYDDRTSADLNFVQSGTGASTRTSQAKMRDVVSVKDFGAIGNGVADDAAAIQLAFDSGANAVFFPEGTYLVGTTCTISGNNRTIYGASKTGSRILLAADIAAITIDTSSVDMYYSQFKNISFEWTGGAAARTATAGFRIIGAANFFAHNSFENIGCYGLFYAIKNDRSTDATGENQSDFNIFINIDTANAAAYATEYFYKALGSGTGNIFANSILTIGTVGIDIGDGTINCGDLIFNGIQFGGAGTGIKLTKGSAYGTNVSVMGCQFDAGLTYGLDFTGINAFKVKGTNWGGGVSNLLPGCFDYEIDGSPGLDNFINASGQITSTFFKRQYATASNNAAHINDESGYHVLRPLGANFNNALWLVSFNNTYTGAIVEIDTVGFLQGVGFRSSKATFHVGRQDSGVTTPTEIDINDMNSTQMEHFSITSNNMLTVNIRSTGAGNNSFVQSHIRAKGTFDYIRRG